MGKFTTLEHCNLTKSWGLDERAALAHLLEELSMEKGAENLSLSRGIYFLGEGSLRLARKKEATAVKKFQSFFELTVVTSPLDDCRCVATEPSTIYYLSLEKWNELKQISPIIAFKLLESITEQLMLKLQSAIENPDKKIDLTKIGLVLDS